MEFEWDENKNRANQEKHDISFASAAAVFEDPASLIWPDVKHSTAQEARYYCAGKIGGRIFTVRFVYREKNIRIFGAAEWRTGRKKYEENQKR